MCAYVAFTSLRALNLGELGSAGKGVCRVFTSEESVILAQGSFQVLGA